MYNGVIQTFRNDEFNLQYIIEGKGKPALVVGSALYYQRTYSQNLRNHLKLVFADHRGFAPNNLVKDKTKFELELLVEDIESLRKKLDLGKLILMGHSGHGYMALEYAKKYPENVSHLVLTCFAPSHSSENHAESDKHFDLTAAQERKTALAKGMSQLGDAISKDPSKAFITFCLLTGAKSWYDYDFDASELWADVEVNMTMFDYVWGEIFRDIDITKGLEKMDVPVFLGLGRYDYLVPPAHTWDGIKEKFKNLTYHIFEKSSHAVHFEEPELFDKVLIEWLKTN
ncbi:AB hydrolase superfamily protein YclE [Leptospira kobayashii]|uniref:AB hydrolase superfamily protein YclE n=1 Tax=Leptospira kobayashii TaxID=1917830 RepID=A0ABN6KA95_9LEPT|nr:alpha/beta hydrolase [Leptospira kobayashii]BDA77470.1 AB hydrolase superfamily protein YclE [Leptospira kobayashii]